MVYRGYIDGIQRAYKGLGHGHGLGLGHGHGHGLGHGLGHGHGRGLGHGHGLGHDQKYDEIWVWNHS